MEDYRERVRAILDILIELLSIVRNRSCVGLLGDIEELIDDFPRVLNWFGKDGCTAYTGLPKKVYENRPLTEEELSELEVSVRDKLIPNVKRMRKGARQARGNTSLN